jgi:DNA-binding beta-propeller fold protein YncE
MIRARLSAATTVLLAALAIAAPAAAKIVHPLTATYYGSATPGGSFTPLGVAVDASSHDLYVSDFAHKLIDKLSPAGAYLCQITGAGESSGSASECDKSAPGPGAFASAFGQGAVEASGALLFPEASAHAIDRFSAAGAYLPPQLILPGEGSPTQLALDAAGNLYVTDTKNHLIDKYTAATETWSTFAGSTPGGPFAAPSPSGVAVDTDPTSPSFGDVYVADPKNHAVDVFSAAGAYKSQIAATPEGPLSSSLGKLATDPTDGHLFVPDAGNGALDEFAPGGVFLTQTPIPSPPGKSSSPQGVAIDPSSGTLYVADKANNVVDVFGSFVVPDVTTKPASGVEETAATLNGHLDPDAAEGGGEVTGCRFEYVKASQYKPSEPNPYAAGETAACSPAPPYGSPEDVSADVSLTPGVTYHFRLEAQNANEVPSYGEDRILSTFGPPVIGAESAYFNGMKAILRAQIDPFGLDTGCQVSYVDEAHFQSSGYAEATTLPCSPEALGSGFGDVEAMATIAGLKVATTYHYRFLATNSAGTTPGADKTFVTFGANPVEYEVIDEEGNPYTEAGGHPYEVRVHVNFNKNTSFPKLLTANLKDVLAKLPAGFIGNPSATPRCTRGELNAYRCSGAAQVGYIVVNGGGEEGLASGSVVHDGIYNLVPPKGVAAEFGADLYNTSNVYIDARLRSDGDYGVTTSSPDTTVIGGGVGEVFVRFWGVPADPSHDTLRGCPGPDGSVIRNCSANQPEPKPFLSNPTSCGGPLTTTLSFDSWQAPGEFDEHAIETPPITGCNQLEFEPMLEARPTTNLADSPSGLKVDLHIPQKPAIEDPEGKNEANLKDTVVTLPAGLNVNPAAASGLEACSSAQVGLTSAPGATPIRFTPAPPNCPDAAKIGTVEVDTPLLEAPLPGAVYLAAPHDNPFDSLLALYIAIDDPETGIVVKLAGHVVPDPETGQLTTSFEENPQLPFEDFKLDFFRGAHASLRTPPTCGTYKTTSELTPWSAPETGPPATPSDTYKISAAPSGGPCPASPAQEPHAPAFEAGTEAPNAGAFSPFVLHLARADDSQEIKGIDTTLPPGLVGKLAGVQECPQGAIEAAAGKTGAEERQSPSCPLASQVGTVNVGAGAGPAPYYVQGTAYLAGPYKGAPLSLAILTPALAGPFDLGTVVVRAALHVNPETAQITAKSDPIPTILQGIPLDVRSIAVKTDRPDFTLNPTSCEKMAVTGVALSLLGQGAGLSSPFQLGGCDALGFKPKLSLSLKGKTRRGGFPALKAVLTMPPGGANVSRAQVTLPHGEFIANAHLRNICTRVQFGEGACPAGSAIGFARAETPLLEKPLEGPVYLMGGFGHTLPDVAVDLNGQVRAFVHGKVDKGKGGGLRNTFEVVPDAPVSKFTIELLGGSKGLLENSGDICAKPQRAIAHFIAQNGKVDNLHPLIANSCKVKRKKHGKHHKRQRRARSLGGLR